MTNRLSGLIGFFVLALFPLALSGQAICSAPHSSPTLSQGGSITALPPGAGWAQVSFFRQRSFSFYNQDGDVQDFLAASDFLTRSVFLTASVGLIEGVDLWAQMPIHNLDVRSDGGNSASSGVGDVRLALRVTPELFGFEAPVGIRFGAKLPANTFPVDATLSISPTEAGLGNWMDNKREGFRIPAGTFSLPCRLRGRVKTVCSGWGFEG